MPANLPSHLSLQPKSSSTVRALFLVSWLSAGIFSIYILVFYGGALFTNAMQDWNQVLPQLYETASRPASIAIGAHFFAGAVVLIMGPLQFIPAIRTKVPALHRFSGRVYALAALGAGLGGLGYLALKGAVGGIMMDLGFAGYGILIVLATANTFRYARARRFNQHRAWAIRLFALGIGSWLYRMDYGIWLKLVGGIGHTHSFDGPFDYVMDFFFYVPNLIVAEMIVRRESPARARKVRPGSLPLVLGIATLAVAVATFLFSRSYWVPHIVARLTSWHGS